MVGGVSDGGVLRPSASSPLAGECSAEEAFASFTWTDGSTINEEGDMIMSAESRTGPGTGAIAAETEKDNALLATATDSAVTEAALREAPSTAGWSEETMERAAARISAGSPLSNTKHTSLASSMRARRYSISAEPYAPSEAHQFHRVVIAKDETTKERIRQAVTPNLLFRSLDSEPLAQIIDAMFEKRVPAGVDLIREGDEGDYFYVVASGQFAVYQGGRHLLNYQAGDTFGELALMYGSPRMATVRSLTESVVWAVDRATFRGIVIDVAFRKRRLYESFLRSVPLLATLHDHELFRICDALQPAVYAAGEVIVVQGEPAHRFFIIEEGEALVTMHAGQRGGETQVEAETAAGTEKEEVEVGRLTAGSYFGELAFLRDAPRAATVRAASEQVKCVTLTKADFIRLLGPLMPILQRNQEHYRKYEEYLSVRD